MLQVAFYFSSLKLNICINFACQKVKWSLTTSVTEVKIFPHLTSIPNDEFIKQKFLINCQVFISIRYILNTFLSSDTKRHEPTILYGRTPHELPPLAIGHVITSQQSIFASMTGPEGGLTTINPSQKHLSTSDPDVDYIDIAEVIPITLEKRVKCPGLYTIFH